MGQKQDERAPREIQTAGTLAIGALSAATGVSVTALRYYDELGLISPTSRVGGKRRFSPDTVGRVNFVRRAQRVGFSLDQIGDLLNDTEGTWGGIVHDRLTELRRQREELDTMIDLLEDIQTCGCRVVADCQRAAMTTPAITKPSPKTKERAQ